MEFYRWLLAIHLIAVISWMAGILYLYRLFVYHAAETETVVKSRFIIMEEKLYNIIAMPAMIVTLILGIALLYLQPNFMHEKWMHVKLTAVFFLIGITHMGNSFRKKLAKGNCSIPSKTFRILNEVPTILMIIIVLMVIVRPF